MPGVPELGLPPAEEGWGWHRWGLQTPAQAVQVQGLGKLWALGRGAVWESLEPRWELGAGPGRWAWLTGGAGQRRAGLPLLQLR